MQPHHLIRTTIITLLPALAAALAGGCASQHLSDDVPDVIRGYRPHMRQVMDNIALFTRDPGAWPSHVLIYKGTYETRNQWTGALGTSTKIENSIYGMTRWELAALDDPYDIRRVRLLYQWQVGKIDFDQLEKQWNEIRDRAVLDGGGKAVLGPDGRPTFLALPLPITRQTRRDWITQKMFDPHTDLYGQEDKLDPIAATRVWATDSEAAAQFSIAILSAMANSRVKARWGDAAMMTP